MKTFQILFVLLKILNYAQSASFDDIALQVDPGSWLIKATLYDQQNDRKYSIKEMIYSGYQVSGKISITSDSGSFDVFYNDRLKDDRLVIHDNQCLHFNYKSKWDSTLSGIENPLLNRILLVGPSLIYRLNAGKHEWKSDHDTEIRGVKMHRDFTYMYQSRLKITRYFRGEEASQPDRIVFYGADATDFISKKRNFIMDFVTYTELSDDVSGLVTVTPGIGCRFYLAAPSPIPNVLSSQLRYLLVEKVKGPLPSSKREEVYADSKTQLLYRKTTSQGKSAEKIYDFSLGISYQLLDNGHCTMGPMAPSDPGVEITYTKSSMSLNLLLNEAPRDKFKFLGIKSIDEQYGHGKHYVYEAVEYHKTTKSGTYDRVVTTQYYIFSHSDLGYEFYSLHSSVINAYKKSDSNSYNLIETTLRNYHDYGYKISGEMYESIFNIGDCYGSAAKETFALTFECRTSKDSCDYFGEKMPYLYSDTLKESIINSGTISASRIANVDVFFNRNETIAYVTIDPIPALKDVFRKESKKVSLSQKAFSSSSAVIAGSSDECLELYTKRVTTFEAVAYCENKICASINKINNLVEDEVNGYGCEIFHVPFKNLNRFERELSFNEIQKGLISRGLGFSLYDGGSLASYSIASITKLSTEIEKLFDPLYTAHKLPENNNMVQLVREAKNLGDCYHACTKNDECQTFSVCLYSDRFDCLVSTFDSATLSLDSILPDQSCTVYRRDLVHNYSPVFNRRYKNPVLISADTHLDNCALLCHKSSECLSFQFCDGQCSSAGLYTDSATEYHQNCSVYIPKVSDKFMYTGHKIVSETHHIELNLTMDQCAALCDAWNAADEPCLSYNYCPEGKTESSCSLSKFSVKSPSTRLVVSDKCTNYEYKVKGKLGSKAKVDQVKGTSGEAAFGIITIFLVVGLVAGITAPIAYKKIKSYKIQKTGFNMDYSLNVNELQE